MQKLNSKFFISKNSSDILNLKKDFFKNNKLYLKKALKLNKLYAQQPKRILCKICNSKKKIFFLNSFNINYYLCPKCQHINGAFQETDNFLKKLYNKGSGAKNIYASYSKDYNERIKKIYNPKVKFLKKIIKRKKCVLDIGSGAGHFLKALEINGIKAIGYETNENLNKLANKFLKNNKSVNININSAIKLIKGEKNANILSLIGVLEHVSSVQTVLEAYKSSRIKYLYISVPIFSLTSFIENAFQNIYPRHLSGGHTHLFTKNSLNFIKKKYNLSIAGEWWFGNDFVDLYRVIYLNQKSSDKKEYIKIFQSNFIKYLDSMQKILDKNKISSEVHIIFKKN